MKNKIERFSPRLLVSYAVLILGAIFMLLPFFWMVLTSLKTRPEAVKVPIQWLPASPQWENYKLIFTRYKFSRYYLNTAIVTVCEVSFQLITCAMAAYVFARLDFPGKSFLFFMCMTVLMVPAQMLLIPRFIITMKMNLLDTLAGIIIPNLPSIYGCFFLRQHFASLPRELDESARLDGCGYFRTFFSILLPLVRNGMVAFGVLTTLWAWNDMLWPMVVVQRQRNYVLSIAISALQGQYSSNTPLLMTAGTLSMLPMLVVFIIGQRSLLSGIALSGIKG